MLDGDQPRRQHFWRYANGWAVVGANGAAVFGTLLLLKLLDEDFHGEHLEYFWLGTLVSFALLAFGLVLAARRPRG